jgi:hypothetical protein
MRALEGAAGIPGRTRTLLKFSLGLAALAFVSRCASAPRAVALRDFAPADEAARSRALEAWEKALQRADSQPPSRLLYDVQYSKGALKSRGTLAVVAGARELSATVSGPFGTAIGNYRDGAFHIQNEEPFRIKPEMFRAILAGVWRGGAPEVGGAERNESLLRWKTSEGYEIDGVLDVSSAQLRSLYARGPGGDLSVAFPGAFAPWPNVVEVVSIKTGQALRLKREAAEPIRE